MRTTAQAIKAAQKRWGKTAAVRDDGVGITRERRESAIAEQKVLIASLPANRKEWTPEQREKVRSYSPVILSGYRYSVGHVVMGLMFSVEGQGDTWDEAFKAADERAAAITKATKP